MSYRMLRLPRLRSSRRLVVAPAATHLLQQQQHQLQTRRTLALAYQQFLTKRLDKETGKWKFKDWGEVYMEQQSLPQEPMKGDLSLQDRHNEVVEHIKPTLRRKIIKEYAHYTRSLKQVDDLTKYVEFVQEHKDDFGNPFKPVKIDEDNVDADAGRDTDKPR